MLVRLLEMSAGALLYQHRADAGDVLCRVNEARAALQLPPLSALTPGCPGRPAACPLRRALHAPVGADGVCFADREAARSVARSWGTPWRETPAGAFVVALPDVLFRFVRDFDLGAFPELVEVAAA